MKEGGKEEKRKRRQTNKSKEGEKKAMKEGKRKERYKAKKTERKNSLFHGKNFDTRCRKERMG